MPNKSYNYAQLEAVAHEMRADPGMVYYYEYQRPISTLPTGEVLDLVKEFGEIRTSGRGWPIDEAWIAGAAIGAAAAGSKAIARMPSMAQLYGIEYVYNQAGKIRSMTGGQASMPFVLWVDGSGRRPRAERGSTPTSVSEALYANLPGIKVVVPSNAYDAKGLLAAAIRDPDPVAYIDYPEVKSGQQPDVPDEQYEVRVRRGRPASRGTRPHDRSLGAGDGRRAAGVARYRLRRNQRGVHRPAVAQAARCRHPGQVRARKTGRLLLVEHGHYTGGFGSHVSGRGRAGGCLAPRCGRSRSRMCLGRLRRG